MFVLLTDVDDGKALILFGEGGAVKALRIQDEDSGRPYTELYSSDGELMGRVSETPDQILNQVREIR